MTEHLSDIDLIDAAHDDATPVIEAHLADCTACASAVAEIRADVTAHAPDTAALAGVAHAAYLAATAGVRDAIERLPLLFLLRVPVRAELAEAAFSREKWTADHTAVTAAELVSPVEWQPAPLAEGGVRCVFFSAEPGLAMTTLTLNTEPPRRLHLEPAGNVCRVEADFSRSEWEQLEGRRLLRSITTPGGRVITPSATI